MTLHPIGTPEPERPPERPQRRFLPKLVPPRRRGDTIRRERLHALMEDALEYDVTLISAPAGYGKSTLAVDWCEDAAIPLAWLSLDQQDMDPLALVGNIVAAVRRVFPDALEEQAQRLETGGQPSAAAAVIAEIAASAAVEVDELFVLALDDLHVLDGAPEAMRVVDALVRSVPMNMRLMLLSRSWPSLGSLARLTAQRRVATVGARDLVFTPEEAAAFLEQSRVPEGEARAQLIRRADGWAAALAVMADHVEGDGSAAVAPELEFILAQFIDLEVLDRLTPQQLDMLTACSVLATFDREFAQALTKNDQAAAVLRELEQSNRFLARLADADSGGEWYRMHALIREHLTTRLEREEPGRLQELRRQAAALCARRGLLVTAVDLSIAAGDWGEVVRELYDTREDLYQRGEWSTLAGWIDRLPEEILQEEADLALVRARLAAKFGQRQECLARLDRIEGGPPLEDEQRVRVLLYRGIAYRDLGRLADAIEACRSARQVALESLSDGHPVYAEIDFEEGVTLVRSGQFPAAKERLAQAVEAFERGGDLHRTAESHDVLGVTTYYSGDLAESMSEFTSAQRRWRMLADPQAQIGTMNNMGNVQHMLGELETARDTFDGVVTRASQIGNHRYEAYGKEGLATVERDLGRLENAITLYTVAIHEAQEIDDPALILAATYGLAMCYRERGEFPRARTLLDHGLRSAEQSGALLQQTRFRAGIGATLVGQQQYQDAIGMLERAVAEAEQSGARREQAVARLLLANACFQGRRRAQALEHLAEVHRITEDLGYDQFLLSEARQMSDLVEYAVARRVGGEYYRSLLTRIHPTQESEREADLPAAFRVRAEAFGGARVTVDGRAIQDMEWRSERSKELFFYLLHRGRPMRKEEIALELWPDVGPKQLNSAFHTTLYRLRKAIHPQVVIQAAGGYQVNPDFDVSYDAAEFEEFARKTDQAEPGTDEWAEGLSKVIGLYRGPFASSFEGEWAEEARRRYEEMYLSSMLALASAALHRGDAAEAITMAGSVIEVDPLNEDATLRLMEAHVWRGNLDLAARAYRRLHDEMRAELGSEPSARVRTLYQRVLSGDALDDSTAPHSR
ncbi:MAG: tetratricopeptide repeat protein [Dehalococcoidia bacterium]|nr:tetratricopeptide repeat protein [Dehalococcoidia bacterium]